jgi:two-component system response regulator LytT
MNIVIIEDEVFAARRLENMILEIDRNAKIIAKLESVDESIKWFKENKHPDLIFLDIHLEDDLSFSIFKETNISSSVVFTTATDELATRAFALLGIDSLYKPITDTELEKVLDKYKKFPPNYSKPIDGSIFDKIINQTLSQN